MGRIKELEDMVVRLEARCVELFEAQEKTPQQILDIIDSGDMEQIGELKFKDFVAVMDKDELQLAFRDDDGEPFFALALFKEKSAKLFVKYAEALELISEFQ